MNLFCLNPKSGEMFLVKSIAKFSPEEFPQAYNRHKPVGLENTEMVFDGGSFKIKVDGEHELELADWRFETYQGKGVLHGILCAGKANAVTISAGLNASTIRFPSKRPIVSMTSHGEDIVIGYRGWSSDPSNSPALAGSWQRKGWHARASAPSDSIPAGRNQDRWSNRSRRGTKGYSNYLHRRG